MRSRHVLMASAVALAILGAGLPIPASVVERWYSVRVYPLLQQVVTPVSNLVPFAWLDVFVLGGVTVAGWVVWRGIGMARRTKRLMPLLSAAWTLVVGAAVVYLMFLVLWGFNYRRVAMATRLEVSGQPLEAEAVVRLGLDAVAELNRLRAAAHRGGWPADPWRDPSLRAAFETTQRSLSDAPPAEPGRLKSSLFGYYFRWAGIDGMIDPLALEVLANPDLLPWERPFVAAHEWAHLAGYAHEAEANFVGWLTCVRADAGAGYSGWLFLYWQIAAGVSAMDRERLSAGLDPGPRGDIEAIHARMRAAQVPFVRAAGWTVYDRYLRANRVDAGIRSYGEVVTLILRAQFTDGWTPVRRGAQAQTTRPAAARRSRS